ncbi:MAG: type II secretion system F family protein [Actinomycetia bacterium]|nr:type II secretion system F family protein [Actinomycetes bacterium]MCP3911202.1 type II secretion system F family protein [Actinomycetes bacterium]MCP4083462.1 type II secretion system F family protein [Actinomycetes bacterium]
MTPSPLLAASIVGLVVGGITRRLAPPARRLGPRVRPYTGWSRSRLGTGYVDPVVVLAGPVPDAGVRTLVVPLVDGVAGRLAQLVDLGTADSLEQRLRHAGWRHLDPAGWRRRQLFSLGAGVGTGTLLAVLLDMGPVGRALVVIGLAFPAGTRERNRLAAAIDLRRARMRNELYTVAQLLAVRVRTGHGPVEAVRSVAELGRGPVVEELRQGLAWISGGTSPREAWSDLAAATPEPMVARLHRLLAASSRSGGDVTGSLLALADDTRAGRREEMARRAVTRRTAMLLPLLGLIAPVMLLFVAAAIPSIVFGIR